MANVILKFITTYPILTTFVVLAFVATCLTYAAPVFTSNNLIISGNLNVGTFLGTFVHMSWSHFIGNTVFLIPVWLYLASGKINPEYKITAAFILLVCFANMLVTGIYGLISDNRLCGLSGVIYMLYGIAGIVGSWLMFIFAIIMFLGECTLLGEEDSTSHVAHIIFFILGIVVGIVRIVLVK